MKSTTILLFLSFVSIISNAADGRPDREKDPHFIAPFIGTYPEFVSDCSTGDRTISSVQMSANPGLPLTGSFVPRVYYRKSASGTWVSRPGTLVSGNATVSNWSFTLVMADIGGLVTGDVVQYYVIAQSTDATPAIASRPAGVVATDVNTVTTAPSAPLSFTVGPTLNGTYNVGAGGDYPNLRTAISAYNISCLAGPVVFNLTDAAYTENTQLTINANPQASATKTLTIKPAAGVTATITGNVVQNFIRIMGSHVTIDGNNGSPGRNLIINDISVQSIPLTLFSADDRNFTSENVNIRNLVTIQASFNYAGIMLSNKLLGGTDGYFKDIRIQNCQVQNAYYGICAFLVSGVGNGSGIEISDNDLSSTGTAAIRRYGIYVKGGENISIKRNLIGNINGYTHDENDAGIWLDAGVRNSIVDGNKIFNLNYTGSAGWGVQGILLSLGITDANVTISNNFISNITSAGYEPAAYLAEPVAIMLSGGTIQSGIRIIHNTIHLYGNTLYWSRAFSAGVYLAYRHSATIMNNIFVNKLGLRSDASTTEPGAPYGAIGIYAETDVTQLTQINNNDYYIASTGPGRNNIGKIGATYYGSLAEWQTVTGGDANSKTIQPFFVSNTDLHLVPATNGLLDNLGTPQGISTDIDNDTRNGTTPDMGADEFTGACVPPSIDVPPSANTICAGSALSLSVTATGTGLTYQWRKGGNDIASANSASYTVNPATATNAGNYDVLITGTCGNITTTPVLVTVNEAPAISQGPTNQQACLTGAASFSVTATGTGLTYQWRKGGNPIASATGATYTISNIAAGDVGSYDVVVAGTCTPSITSSAATLSLYAAPAISNHPENKTVCAGSPVTFSVTATGSGLTYQWRKGGNPIASATNSSYTISPVTAADAGSYDVVVSGTCTPSVTSNAATLALPATNSWLGTVSTDWNNAANWCLGIPSSTSDITITAGTPFSPVVATTTGVATVRNLVIANGATMTVSSNAWFGIYGNLTINGSFLAPTGTVEFKGIAGQSVTGFTVGNILLNGTGGITLVGDMMVRGTLTCGTENLLLGSNNITLNRTPIGGSVSSHIITNGSGNVIMDSIIVPAVTIPVGPDATSYNPVIIANGGGRDYSINVKTGITPDILLPNVAINRTWKITPDTLPASKATVTLQYADADGNAGTNGGGLMEVGVHNGSTWLIASPGISPTGTSIARQVSYSTSLFGPTVVTNPGGLSYPLAVSGLDPSISSVQLLPNVVNRETLLRVRSSKAMRTDWILTDMNGKIMRTFSRLIVTGTNDISLDLGYLPMGVYQLRGITQKGMTGVLRMVKF